MSQIALFGSTGMIGQCILQEAEGRGHEVTMVGRDQADIFDPESVRRAIAGHDVVISAYGPGKGDPQSIVRVAHSLIDGVRGTGARLIVIGGAGGLEIQPGLQLVDAPGFPPAWRDLALAHRDAYTVYQSSDLDWTYAAPAAIIEPGARTGEYRIGTDRLVTDPAGNSRISAEDFAVAIIDEVEGRQSVRRRFTAAY